MPKRTISSELAMKLITADKNAPYKWVSTDVIDEWRWGNVYETVVQDKQDDTFWGFTYQEQSGDHYHNSLEDDDETEMYQLVATEVVKVVFARAPEPETTN